MSIPRLPELLLILVIVLLIFGAGKLPEVASSLGKSIKQFRKESQTEEAAAAKAEAKKQETKPENV